VRPTDALRAPEDVRKVSRRRPFQALPTHLAALCCVTDAFRRSSIRPPSTFLRRLHLSGYRHRPEIRRLPPCLSDARVDRRSRRRRKRRRRRRPARSRRLRKGRLSAWTRFGPDQHFTEPPPRFNDATLVKELEEDGIGRPSTYASIISTIVEREYVTKNQDASRPPCSASASACCW